LTIGIIDGFQSPLADREMQSSMERSQILDVFPPSLNTAVFVDRKNYRLQDIQLSKISRGSFAPPEPPQRASLAGPLAPRSARAGALAIARAPRARSCGSLTPDSLRCVALSSRRSVREGSCATAHSPGVVVTASNSRVPSYRTL
jgi:hypothetical protein